MRDCRLISCMNFLGIVPIKTNFSELMVSQVFN